MMQKTRKARDLTLSFFFSKTVLKLQTLLVPGGSVDQRKPYWFSHFTVVTQGSTYLISVISSLILLMISFELWSSLLKCCVRASDAAKGQKRVY